MAFCAAEESNSITCAPAEAHAWSLLSELQVVDRSETEVTCVATNSATLDGLLNVMVCHTEVSGCRSGKPAGTAGGCGVLIGCG